jgi:hypothetical protein
MLVEPSSLGHLSHSVYGVAFLFEEVVVSYSTALLMPLYVSLVKRTVLDASLVPWSIAQLRLELIHALAHSSRLPVLVTGAADDKFMFWRGLMMCGQPNAAKERRSRRSNIVTSPFLLETQGESR